MKRQEIPEWHDITEYRTPVFEQYEFDFKMHENAEPFDPKSRRGIDVASLNYAREIVGDPNNDKWLERRKLSDAFKMGIEFAKRHLNGG